jgi:hypothetical protein
MEVTTAMLADAARVESGKLYIHGGAWDTIDVGAVPAVHPTMALALVFRIEYDQALADIPFLIELVDEDDRSLGPRIEGVMNAGHPPRTRRGTPSFQPLAMTFNMVSFDHEGGYRFKVVSQDRELASVPFRVRTAPSPG